MRYILLFIVGFFFLTDAAFAQETAVIEWAKRIGSGTTDRGYDIAIDGAGNTYTSGYFTGTVDFDPGAGVFNMTATGTNDIFILKLDPNGNFIWAKRIGGAGSSVVAGIALDASGNVFITGGFAGTADFDPGPATFNMTAATTAQHDIYVCKLDNNGNFVWAKGIIGGTWWDNGLDIVVDATGNVHVTGRYYYQGGARDFDPGPGTFFLTADWEDVFILKLDNNGNFIWAKDIGTVQENRGYSIALDASGNVYTTGYFKGTTDFDPGAGTFNLTSSGDWDIFFSKLDASGNFVWAKGMVNTAPNYYTDGSFGSKIKLDASGNLYATGRYSGTVDFDFGPATFNLTAVGDFDIYVTKMNSNGDFVWAKSMGGSGYDEGFSLALNPSGDIYIAGFYSATIDFDPGAPVKNLTSAGNSDIYVLKLDNNGNLVWVQSMGGTSADSPFGITVDGSGYIYLAGWFGGTADFDPGACTYNLVSAGSDDIFVEKLRETTTPTLSITSFSPANGAVGTPVTITGTGFSATPGNNQVTFFNNQTATVSTNAPTSIGTIVPAGATDGKISVTTGCVTVQSTANFVITPAATITITLQPANLTVCAGSPASMKTAATGTTNITYQWQVDNSGFVNLSDDATYSGSATGTLAINNPSISLNGKIYRCVVSGDLAASVITSSATLLVNAIPGIATIGPADLGCGPATTDISPTGAIAGESYRFYDAAVGGNLLLSDSVFSTPTLTTSTTYFVSTYNTTTQCESARVAANVLVQTCNTPVVMPTTSTAFIEGIVTIDLEPLISDPDDNLDPTTLEIISPPISGADFSLNGFILTINYAGVPFPGTDNLQLRVCDLTGICAQQQLTITLDGDITVFNAVSPNHDSKNEMLFLQYIDILPETQNNKVTIYNRWGDIVFEIDNYNNTTRTFTGLTSSGNQLPSGTYFYRIDFDNKPPKKGYLSLQR